ncbi:MAG: hypothetical protein WEB30_17385, partial [Cyclobacteriaceae bacterium]
MRRKTRSLPTPHFKRGLVVFFLLTCFLATDSFGQKRSKDKFAKKSLVGKQRNDSYIVSTSQIIDPAGDNITFPGRPIDLALNSPETILAVKNFNDIVFLDAINHSIKQTLPLPAGGNTFTGIGWSDNGQKVWTTDTKGYLRSAKLQGNGLFAWGDEILLPSGIKSDGQFEWENQILDKSARGSDQLAYPGGFAIDEKRGYIYVALNRDNAVGIVNLKTNKFEGHFPVGIAPYSVMINGDKAYV